jgi:type IV secretion system protein TrbJ
LPDIVDRVEGRMKRAKFRIIVLGIAYVVVAEPATAQLSCPCIVTDPTLESTTATSFGKDLLNQSKELATQANQYLNEINQYALQVQQYENEIQNTISLPGQVVGNIQGVINHAFAVTQNIVGIYQRAEGLAVSVQNIDKQFQLRFPGYIATGPIVGGPVPAQSQQVAIRLNGTLDSIRGSMDALNLNVMDLANDQMTASNLNSLSLGVTGTVQALQVTHQIALQQVAQMTKLHSDIDAIGQAETNYFANQIQNKTDENAALARVFHPLQDAW